MGASTVDRQPDEIVLEDTGKVADQKTWDLDTMLGFGYYQYFQVWVVQTLIAIIGAMNYFHLMFMVSDPPEWGCNDDTVETCSDGQGEKNICGGEKVVFNTSHQNFIRSLPVDHHWLCDKVFMGKHRYMQVTGGHLRSRSSTHTDYLCSKIFATTQLNSTQSWVGLIFLCKTTTTNRPSLFLSSYTTKLDQIQYATLFRPN